jgi:hypothetical protein
MNFDLNIENYSRDELREMFDIPINYDKNIIEMKEAKLRDSIINDKNIDKQTQNKTINFLIKAKTILLNNFDENIKSQTKNNTNNNSNGNIISDIQTLYNLNYNLKPVNIENPEEHMVQDRKKKPYLESFPSEYFPGIINPLKRRTRKENLIIDTRFRENYYNSSPTNFNFQLPILIQNVLTMQLTAIELPSTYFVISKQYNNNFFSIVVNGEGKVITIPDGNYDNNSLTTIINKNLLDLGGYFQYINFVINVCGSNGSGQMMVGLDCKTLIDEDIKFELNFQADRFGYDDRNTPLPLKLGWMMGFRNGIYTNNLNYVSEAIVDLAGPRYFYLVVDDFNNNNNNGLFYSAFNSSLLNKNIIARISLQTSTFNILLENNLNILTTAREYFGPVDIRNFQIQLLDEYGRVVDLNYMDFSFCLTMTISYDI